MRIIMTAADFSPAVASRRAKYVEDFRVPTPLGAQPLDAQHFFGGFSGLGSAVPERRATPQLVTHAADPINFS